MTLFIEAQKQKQLSTAVTLMMYLSQSIIQLYQMYKSLYEKVSSCIIDSANDHNVRIS